MRLTVGEPVSKEQETLGEEGNTKTYEVWVYPYFRAYVLDGKIAAWKLTQRVADGLVETAIESYAKAYELDPKSADRVKAGLKQISDFCSQEGNVNLELGDFKAAADAFGLAYAAQAVPAYGGADPELLYYAGYLETVNGSKDPASFAKGAEYLEKAIEEGYEGEEGLSYYYLFYCYYGQKDADPANLQKAKQTLLTGLDKYNNIYMMADSGARGSDKQIKQLAGMRGLMADTTGHTIELPIKSNFREGLDVLEYFISAHGARKGLSDTALRTADSGYLTRRLVDVSQDLIVRETDCCEGKEIPYMEIKAFTDGQETIESLEERLTGRYIAETITDPDTGEVVVKANHMCTPKRAAAVMKVLKKLGRDSVKIRTVLTCKSHIGVCAKCYGANMATGQPVQVGEAVGIIAAQSIGEPGTQLTMRTFHTGGVAGGDITQGLPRVEELFEARKPKGLAIITEFGGVVAIKDTKKKREIVVTDPETGNSKTYLIPYGSRIKVTEGQVLEAGDELTEGSINPHDILKIKGVRAVQDYMIQEVQRVYRLQGVEINDKHVEVIVRQMLKKVKVEESGDSDVLPGVSMNVLEFNDMNEALIAQGKKPAEGKQVMLGITKASLATDSFLSAASFQETTKVLTDAAIKGKVDHLVGLKENVIIGKLIPAGSGLAAYRDYKLTSVPQDEEAPEVPVQEDEVQEEADVSEDTL